jgi:pyruvate,orthophosphate dikinase
VINKGDWITIDGTSGEVMLGQIPTLQPELSGDFATLMVWADKVRRLKVRTNADTPEDTRTAREFGAEGIGLCRTEHMFFDEARIVTVREMILAKDEAGRRAALAKLLPMQRQDFTDLFEIMSGLPVTIRLLDPPLHEFLPHTAQDLESVAEAIGVSADEVKARANELHEVNPMLGHRGCRLGISYPEIYEMQARAIFEASIEAGKSNGVRVIPEIMIPLVGDRKEVEFLKERIIGIAKQIEQESKDKLEFLIGTMIELPRAAIQAGDIAAEAEFFSFGTNDLTQTVYGISRDDSARFMNDYLSSGIWKQDPFVSLDQQGVGALISMAAEQGRRARPNIKLGICGEHGGDPASIDYCERISLDYVSCSPYRVPIARLAAAQAAIRHKLED